MSMHERVLGLQHLTVNRAIEGGEGEVSTVTLGSDISVACCCTDDI